MALGINIVQQIKDAINNLVIPQQIGNAIDELNIDQQIDAYIASQGGNNDGENPVGSQIICVAPSDMLATKGTNWCTLEGFNFSFGANEKWAVSLFITWTSSKTAGLKLRTLLPMDTSLVLASPDDGWGQESGTSLKPFVYLKPDEPWVRKGAGEGVYQISLIQGSMITYKDVGELSFEFAQNVADKAKTAIYGDSYMIATRLA